MSVPTHNLYDFVHQSTKKQFFILYFSPWGSRDLKNVRHYQASDEHVNGPNGIKLSDRAVTDIIPQYLIDSKWATFVQPILLCHDQEPLNYKLYSDDNNIIHEYRRWYQEATGINFSPYVQDLNLRTVLPQSLHRTWILLHSELNSDQVHLYESTGRYKGAYWWSHAAIARDWYRFAQYDKSFDNTQYSKLFLTYCRDTTGSRQYRQKFIEQVHQLNLIGQCQTKSISDDEVTSDASAIYNVADFNATAISVILETVFDQRIHLTEKTLRPIACGHPFIIAAGPGSLKLLRNYGFRTFSDFINESYDNISNDTDRLSAITCEMQRIRNLPAEEQHRLILGCQSIAAYNQKHFFSDSFFNSVTLELEQNVQTAFDFDKGVLDASHWWRDHNWRKIYQPEASDMPYYKNFSQRLVKFCEKQYL